MVDCDASAVATNEQPDDELDAGAPYLSRPLRQITLTAETRQTMTAASPKITTLNQYIDAAPDHVRGLLRQLRATIRE